MTNKIQIIVATLIVAALGLVGCSSDDTGAQPGPYYDETVETTAPAPRVKEFTQGKVRVTRPEVAGLNLPALVTWCSSDGTTLYGMTEMVDRVEERDAYNGYTTVAVGRGGGDGFAVLNGCVDGVPR